MRAKKAEGVPFYFDAVGAADYLGVCRRTVDRWQRLGLVSRVKIGRVVRYRRRDLDAMMEGKMCRINLAVEPEA